MLKHFAAWLLGLAALLVAIAPAAADKRVALVIGNSAYENVPRLQNPSNDASDMAAKLRGLGFEVVEGIDLGKRDMEKNIRAFADQLTVPMSPSSTMPGTACKSIRRTSSRPSMPSSNPNPISISRRLSWTSY